MLTEKDTEHDRTMRGYELLSQIDGHGGRAVIDSLTDIAPHVGQWIVNFAFGEVYARPQLSLRDRELATIACLCSQGATEPQLKVHVQGALNAGLSAEEVVEAFSQCIPYVGFPRVLNALAVAREVFSEREQ